ncbi:putative heterokaryon incompatibility protein [Rosellinia necatrix]|uniref:Putative heterokaryon incompatibility protein n=1 Tax=Rosellinia necatrix TaxID=77044 RepID=A0A1W2TSQ4_ROSNE|nr:putative heterokaryon incompatibility protein [Rosellinia necatrix]
MRRFQPEQGSFCALCREIDAALRPHGSAPHPPPEPAGARDVYLGRKSELLARSPRCPSCCALVACVEGDRGDGLPASQASSSSTVAAAALTGDYELSAHVMEQNPVLCIAFGSLQRQPESTDAGARRRALMRRQLSVLPLFSTACDVPEGSPPWLAGTPRLFDPRRCDPAVIRDWLGHCRRFHGSRCSAPNAWRPRDEITNYFIDVELQCVVTPAAGEEEVPFVALSYVWGAVDTLQALKSNIGALMRPGSLAPSAGALAVPRTIRDAMSLCALVGQRYLWVDRVCIVQDDYAVKGRYLQAMAWIYAAAEFTIVAADGSDADYGLSGVSQSVEERQKHLIPFPSGTLIRGTLWTLGDSLSSKTVWSSRAWTFQEHVFSRRLLYVDKFVNWVCASARWTEALSLSPNAADSVTKSKEEHDSADGKLFVLNWPSLRHYASMVEQYNMRRITYDSDVANAFGGLMSQMCMGFSAGFYGGMPEFYFTMCLLWQPKRGLRPRFDQPDTRFLPTWSWLGWSGELDLQMWTCNTEMEFPPAPYEVTITPVTEWFKAPEDDGGGGGSDSKSRIEYTYSNVRTFFLGKGAPTPPGWTRHDGDAGSGHQPYYTYHEHHHIGATRKFRYPIPPLQRFRDVVAVDLTARHLYANVQRAFFLFGAPGEEEEEGGEGEGEGEGAARRRPGHLRDNGHDVVELPLYTASSAWAGFMRVNVREDEALPVGQRCEAVRVAGGSVPVAAGEARPPPAGAQPPPMFNPGEGPPRHPFANCVARGELGRESTFEFYFVLWIRWDGDTACRRALGVVWKPVWNQAAPADIDIKLG